MTTQTREQLAQLCYEANIQIFNDDVESRLTRLIKLARADLEATIAEQAAEIDLLRVDKHNLYRSWSELRQQLAESQAREQGLREALSELIDLVGDMVSGEYKYDSFTLQPAREALSQPTDSTALQEWGVKN